MHLSLCGTSLIFLSQYKKVLAFAVSFTPYYCGNCDLQNVLSEPQTALRLVLLKQ
jgi:hypothetical protein